MGKKIDKISLQNCENPRIGQKSSKIVLIFNGDVFNCFVFHWLCFQLVCFSLLRIGKLGQAEPFRCSPQEVLSSFGRSASTGTIAVSFHLRLQIRNQRFLNEVNLSSQNQQFSVLKCSF